MGKKQAKDDKKKKQKQDGKTIPFGLIFLGVALACLAALMPKLLKKKNQDTEIKFSFPAPPDERSESCPKVVHAERNARDSVSIIIPYLNEEWFRIEATMQSLIAYTDLSLVREIMWISDGNVEDKKFVSELKAMHAKVSVHENEKNLGLITTKMQAASRAKGSVLMFLEPHVLVTSGWLEPLLKRLSEEPKALIMPALDALGEDLSYHRAGVGHWRFEWNMNLIYTNPSRASHDGGHLPWTSPATSGGIYAIRKDWWDKLELFDPELVRWGGDHVEASHKVWRCGGRIEVHPCSRVGHWFREEDRRPYDVKVESVVRNYKRLAEVWFDEHIEKFYQVKPEAREMDIGNVTDMKDRRERLACKDMSWYIQHVDVELGWETDKICIPDAPESAGGCGFGTVPAAKHSTITEAVPLATYEKLIASAEAHKGGPCCRTKGRGCYRICKKDARAS